MTVGVPGLAETTDATLALTTDWPAEKAEAATEAILDCVSKLAAPRLLSAAEKRTAAVGIVVGFLGADWDIDTDVEAEVAWEGCDCDWDNIDANVDDEV